MKLSTTIVLLGAVANAQPSPAPEARPSADAKATTIALLHPDVSEETMIEVMHAIDTGLKKDAHLEFKDLDARLADFAQDLPQDQIDAAHVALTDGQKELEAGNFPVAQQKLAEAVSGLAKVLPYIKKQELADAMAAHAVALAEGGEKAAARKAFLRLLIWRSNYDYYTSGMPAKFGSIFDEANKELAKLKTGALRIASSPDGAEAFVDGARVGLTPCAATGLVAGEHYVTFKKEGYKKAVAAKTIVAHKEESLSAALERNEKYLLIEQTVAAIDQLIGKPEVPPEMDPIRQVLFVDQVVFVRAKPKGPTDIEVTAYLYDLRSKRRAAMVTQTVPRKDAETKLAELAPELYKGVNYTGELTAPEDKLPDKPKDRPPVYKTWWFWLSIGAVAALGAGTAGVVVATRAPSCPDGSLCPVVRF